jgi:rhomboid protease GluP
MSLDWVVYWMAIIYCLAFLVALARSRFAHGLAWGAKCAIVLVLAAAAYWQQSELLQQLTGGAWVLLLAVPTAAARLSAREVWRGRYDRAARLVRFAAWFHPFGGWRVPFCILGACARAARGDLEQAKAELRALLDDPRTSPRARPAIRAQLLRIAEDWEGLADLSDEAGAGDPLLLLMSRIRALGETGRVHEMVRLLARYPFGRGERYLMCRLSGLAFCGRVATVARLLPLLPLDGEVKEFWLATAELAGGAREQGLMRLAAIADSDDAITAAAVRRRRTVALARPQDQLTAADEQTIAAIENGLASDAAYGRAAYAGISRSYVILGLILVNVGAYLVELARGVSENEDGLIKLGALDSSDLFSGGEWWRLATATFLHFGLLHLLLNMFALLVIGVWVEQMLGRWRTLAIYLAAGVGSAAFVAVSMPRDEVLVGASGAIFGLVGAQIVLLAQGLRRRRSRLAQQRLVTLGLVILLQVLFDLATPEVSGAAHMAGLVVGAAAAALVMLGRARPEVA